MPVCRKCLYNMLITKDPILDSLWISVFQNSKATPSPPHPHTHSSAEERGCLRRPMSNGLLHRTSPLIPHLRLACYRPAQSLPSSPSQAPNFPTRLYSRGTHGPDSRTIPSEQSAAVISVSIFHLPLSSGNTEQIVSGPTEGAFCYR